VHFSPDGSKVLTSSLDRTAILWPAVKVGPSLKLSRARLEIPRTAGLHPLDPLARVIDPNASDLAGATLTVSLTAESGSAVPSIELSGGEFQEVRGQVMHTVGSEKQSVADIRRTASPAGTELRLAAGVTTDEAQQLLRAVAIRAEQPLVEPLTLVVQITSSGGELLSEARATVQTAEVGEPESLAAAGAR
jgi:hypothetical protein